MESKKAELNLNYKIKQRQPIKNIRNYNKKIEAIYKIKEGKIKLIAGKNNFEDSIYNVYTWLSKELEKTGNKEKIKNLEEYIIFIDRNLSYNRGFTNYKTKTIRLNPNTISIAKNILVHEFTHGIRKKDNIASYNNSFEDKILDEGAAVFFEMLYGFKQKGEIAKDILTYLYNKKTLLDNYLKKKEYILPNIYNEFNELFEEAKEKPSSLFLPSILSEKEKNLLKTMRAYSYLVGSCVFLEIAEKKGIKKAEDCAINCITSKDFEKKYETKLSVVFPQPKDLFEKYSSWLKKLEEAAKEKLERTTI